jgi:hypothetical protein
VLLPSCAVVTTCSFVVLVRDDVARPVAAPRAVAGGGKSVFVGDLPPDASEDDVRTILRGVPGIESISLTKPRQ